LARTTAQFGNVTVSVRQRTTCRTDNPVRLC
jgi:hypothetical protein